jgi:hypothetical protein
MPAADVIDKRHSIEVEQNMLQSRVSAKFGGDECSSQGY